MEKSRLEIAEELIEELAELFHHMPKNEQTHELWSRICSFRKDSEVKTEPMFDRRGKITGHRLVDGSP